MKRSPKIQQAIEHLRKAVHLLCDDGYANLSPDEQCACNWVNMAKEQLTRSDIKPSVIVERYIQQQYVSPKITVGGAGPAQQVRMDKAARRMAKKLRRSGVIYF